MQIDLKKEHPLSLFKAKGLFLLVIFEVFNELQRTCGEHKNKN